MKDGHLVLDEPVDLPEGTVIDMMPVDQGDDLDQADRERLHAASIGRKGISWRAGAFRLRKCWQRSARDQVGETSQNRILPRRACADTRRPGLVAHPSAFFYFRLSQ